MALKQTSLGDISSSYYFKVGGKERWKERDWYIQFKAIKNIPTLCLSQLSKYSFLNNHK